MHPADVVRSSPAAPSDSAHRHIPGIRVYGDGPPFVLVPGMDGTGLLFHRQVPSLARDYRVATWPLRDDAPSMAALVADLADVVRSVGGGAPATVAGESFGGALALSFALAHPELVDRLVVINSFPHFRPQHRLALAIAGIRLMPWGAMALVRRVTAVRMHSRHTHREEMRRFLLLTSRTTRAGYLSRLRILREYDVRARLPELHAPTLLLASEQDRLVPSAAQARLMASLLPDATVRVLDGHGHVCLIAPGVDLAGIVREWRATGETRTSAPARE